MAFYAFNALPVNYAGLALIGLGIVLFIAEALTPTFGLLTLGGLASMGIGSLMLIKNPLPGMDIPWSIIIGFTVATGGITFLLVTLSLKAYRARVTTGKKGMIGLEAEAIANFKKNKGTVLVHGEIWIIPILP